MATFTVIEAIKAPPRLQANNRLKERMAEYEQYVVGLKKGQVGVLTPSGDETPRSVQTRISRAGKRLGADVDAWSIDGVVYFKRR